LGLGKLIAPVRVDMRWLGMTIFY